MLVGLGLGAHISLFPSQSSYLLKGRRGAKMVSFKFSPTGVRNTMESPASACMLGTMLSGLSQSSGLRETVVASFQRWGNRVRG